MLKDFRSLGSSLFPSEGFIQSKYALKRSGHNSESKENKSEPRAIVQFGISLVVGKALSMSVWHAPVLCSWVWLVITCIEKRVGR